MKQVAVETKVLSENQRVANDLRERFRRDRALVLNLISAPGSGKTSLLECTLERFDPATRIAVLTGDIQTDNDARRIARAGFPVKQVTTGGTCHLDARMIEKHLDGWPADGFDILFIENVGNLVCPSSYDLGEAAKIVLLSVAEGEDKPLKYPSIFLRSALCLISKIDLLPYVPFSVELARQNALTVHPQMEIVEISSASGHGMELWMQWILRQRMNILGGSSGNDGDQTPAFQPPGRKRPDSLKIRQAGS